MYAGTLDQERALANPNRVIAHKICDIAATPELPPLLRSRAFT